MIRIIPNRRPGGQGHMSWISLDSKDGARKVCQEWMSRRTLRFYDQRHGPLFGKLCLIILIELYA